MDFPATAKKIKSINYRKQIIYILIVVFLILWFAFALDIYKTYKSNTENKLILGSRATQNFDNNVSQIIYDLKDIYKWYKQNTKNNWSTNILTTYDKQISQIITNLPKIAKRVPKDYTDIYNKFLQFIKYKNDIYNLLGASGNKTYLIALMNTNEIRPNGGFWWSYIIVNISGGVVLDNKIYDSYYPNYIYSGLAITWSKWLEQLYDTSKVWFVSSNKIGFTDRDGYNISRLYEKAFVGQKLDWVIFIKSSAVRDILWGRDGKFREWQFVNANIDQISWADTKNKKQIYINELQKYIDTNKENLIAQFAKNSQKLISDNNIQVYLPYVSIPFRDRLVNNNLTTSYSPEYIYSYDTNMSYSKVDWFITKQIYYNNKLSTNTHKIPNIGTWILDLDISYTLNIPNIYTNYIYSLTRKYNVTLTSRETHILALDNIRNNRWILRLPKWSKLMSLTWDYYDYKTFTTPFADWIMYFIKNNKNHTNKSIKLKIMVK